MITLPYTFGVSEKAASGILNGSLSVVGSVVRHAQGAKKGRIFEHLIREIPSDGQSELSPLGVLGNLTGMGMRVAKSSVNILEGLTVAGNVCSILNLGATVAFGVIICRKLSRLHQNVENLQWSVDLGFERLEQRFNSQTMGELQGAASLMDGAQELEPEGSSRAHQIQHALGISGVATKKLLNVATADVNRFSENLPGPAVKRFDHLKIARATIHQLRMAAAATQLHAMISAEATQIRKASHELKVHRTRIVDAGHLLGQGVLFGKHAGALDFFRLMVMQADPGRIPYSRLQRWYRLFAHGPADKLELAEIIRKAEQSGVTPPKALPQIPADLYHVADEADGLLADLDRLEGMALELESCADRKLSWKEYRELLSVKEDPKGARLVVFTPPSDLPHSTTREGAHA